MGWLSHIYEAEYIFPDDAQADAIRAAIVEALESTPRYAHITAEAELQHLFQRHGDQHSVRHAYHDHEVANAELTVYVSLRRLVMWLQGTHSTKVFKFVDDLAFTFATVDGKTVVHTLSISRIGQGDMFQNRKNISIIMDTVNARMPYERVVVLQK
ncbi:uncharacterized protein ACA1_290180 [Acanthamoeba castellanii str. Neff]|uniref:Uncharacterized protein n=1 Tax=Acanthamoeba castellanii (strain ATCC 30010 / Neff) TaxID=1257118 RepID=L8HI45_ACACF|nr:uncharacterized protein ACA1_290180 [Acanthamoeba castellanii str. Neff]ELR25254.1 hypothetical protein ACA1_290180 [Acanthamoeba castellanii str. Neff]